MYAYALLQFFCISSSHRFLDLYRDFKDVLYANMSFNDSPGYDVSTHKQIN